MRTLKIYSKLLRVRNFPLLGVRLIRGLLPGGFLSSSAHLHKQLLIKKIKLNFGFSTFVETGTNEGAMIEAVKNQFTYIYSIELDQHLYHRAKDRFAGQMNIKIFQGDSAEVLPSILRVITTPSLFWLDAHYSGGTTAKGATETPILQEIDEILKHHVRGHLILIDDAWSFGTIKDYPTISELKRHIRRQNPCAKVKIFSGVIWVYDPSSLDC